MTTYVFFTGVTLARTRLFGTTSGRRIACWPLLITGGGSRIVAAAVVQRLWHAYSHHGRGVRGRERCLAHRYSAPRAPEFIALIASVFASSLVEFVAPCRRRLRLCVVIAWVLRLMRSSSNHRESGRAHVTHAAKRTTKYQAVPWDGRSADGAGGNRLCLEGRPADLQNHRASRAGSSCPHRRVLTAAVAARGPRARSRQALACWRVWCAVCVLLGPQLLPASITAGPPASGDAETWPVARRGRPCESPGRRR